MISAWGTTNPSIPQSINRTAQICVPTIVPLLKGITGNIEEKKSGIIFATTIEECAARATYQRWAKIAVQVNVDCWSPSALLWAPLLCPMLTSDRQNFVSKARIIILYFVLTGVSFFLLFFSFLSFSISHYRDNIAVHDPADHLFICLSERQALLTGLQCLWIGFLVPDGASPILGLSLPTRQSGIVYIFTLMAWR